MRILMVHGDVRPPGEAGGAESLLRDQANALKARGHQVAWCQNGIAAALESFQPDVCHLMTVHCYDMGLAAAEHIQHSGIPHIWHLQDYWPFCGGRMKLKDNRHPCPEACDADCQAPPEYREIVNRSFIVAGNAYTADIYRAHGVRCDAVVELGIDTDAFRPGEKDRDSIYASTAWADAPWKGMDVVREALLGTGWNVNLITGLPRDKVAEALSKADIYIFPSIYEETFGLCLCEAMASGCACIASDVAGARAQIADRVTGLLVPPRDPQALKEAIQYMLDNPSHRESMGFVARRHVEMDHSLDAMAERWERVYEEVLNGS